MFEALMKIADSELPSLIPMILLVLVAGYYNFYIVPRLHRLKQLELNPPNIEETRAISQKVEELSNTLETISQNVNKIQETFGDHHELLEDVQYSCHNTRHELADVKGRIQNIASTLGTDGRDDDGFCDLRELR